MGFHQRITPKGAETEGGDGGGGNYPNRPGDHSELPAKREPQERTFSPEAKTHIELLRQELTAIMEWVLKSRTLYQTVAALQKDGPPREFQVKKNALWQSYKTEVLPILQSIASNRPSVAQQELTQINTQIDNKFNPKYHPIQKPLEKQGLRPSQSQGLKKLLIAKSPIDEYTLHVKVPNIPAQFLKSLETFWLAENFKKPVETNSFRMGIWLSKIQYAIFQLDNFLINNFS